MSATGNRIGGLFGLASAAPIMPVYLTLTTVGVAAEVAVPAAIAQFNDLTGAAYSQPFLALSFWLDHFSQIGSAALIFATAFIVWRSGVLPRWTALLAVLGILPLIHTWMGLYAGYSTVLWIALMSPLLLTLPAYKPPAARQPETLVEPVISQPKHQSVGA